MHRERRNKFPVILTKFFIVTVTPSSLCSPEKLKKTGQICWKQLKLGHAIKEIVNCQNTCFNYSEQFSDAG